MPEMINDGWSMDFMHDQPHDGCSYSLLNAIDDFNWDCVGIEVAFSLPAERDIRPLDRITKWRDKPRSTRCGDDREYISVKLSVWAKKREFNRAFIQPDKPQQNSSIERYNRTARHYNHERSNMRLRVTTPQQKVLMMV